MPVQLLNTAEGVRPVMARGSRGMDPLLAQMLANVAPQPSTRDSMLSLIPALMQMQAQQEENQVRAEDRNLFRNSTEYYRLLELANRSIGSEEEALARQQLELQMGKAKSSGLSFSQSEITELSALANRMAKKIEDGALPLVNQQELVSTVEKITGAHSQRLRDLAKSGKANVLELSAALGAIADQMDSMGALVDDESLAARWGNIRENLSMATGSLGAEEAQLAMAAKLSRRGRRHREDVQGLLNDLRQFIGKSPAEFQAAASGVHPFLRPMSSDDLVSGVFGAPLAPEREAKFLLSLNNLNALYDPKRRTASRPEEFKPMTITGGATALAHELNPGPGLVQVNELPQSVANLFTGSLRPWVTGETIGAVAPRTRAVEEIRSMFPGAIGAKPTGSRPFTFSGRPRGDRAMGTIMEVTMPDGSIRSVTVDEDGRIIDEFLRSLGPNRFGPG